MTSADLVRLAGRALLAHRLRSILSMLGIAIGVGSVIVLTSIGEGAREYVLAQFSQFGTNLIAIHPGKAKTTGMPGMLGGTTHQLTLEDALALRRIRGVEGVVPLAFGLARVEHGERGRSVMVYGVTPDIQTVWRFHTRQGGFWRGGDPRRGEAETVLGPKLARELFGEQNPLGRFVRAGGARLRVVGVMEPKGMLLGFDLDDSAYVPVATALDLFNQIELGEIDVAYAHPDLSERVQADLKRVLMERHDGEEDFTITSQEAMLEVSGNVLRVITMAVGAIAGISLLVGAIGILTMMWIAVGERRGEIGLARAIGASRAQVWMLFLYEAVAVALVGGVAGIAGGLGLCAALGVFLPGLPVRTPLEFVLAALLTSVATGVASGVLPARRAAALDPIEALRAE
ncbi:MAG TPA: ABC transporter permease [Candidatus Limnocylindria bacterium]|nr:ABC transporter permease [Candidatus Limnocylindria bacterium]